MGPKLLPRTEANIKTKSESAAEVIRIQELRKMEDDLRLSLAKREAEFASMMAQKRKEWERENDEHIKHVESLSAEIVELENKKHSMSVPFDILKQGAFSDMKDAEDILNKLREREKKNDELSELLQEKLDAVGEREQNVKKREQLAIVREKSIKEENISIKKGHDVLKQAILDFNAEMSRIKSENDERTTKILIREKNVSERESVVEGRNAAMNEQEKYFKDQREVLERAFAEVRRREQKLPPQ